jgi:hypothetical protein
MPGLVPGIYVFLSAATKQDVDGRDKPGHDGFCVCYGPGSAKQREERCIAPGTWKLRFDMPPQSGNEQP